jgi:hypothetical protein
MLCPAGEKVYVDDGGREGGRERRRGWGGMLEGTRGKGKTFDGGKKRTGNGERRKKMRRGKGLWAGF